MSSGKVKICYTIGMQSPKLVDIPTIKKTIKNNKKKLIVNKGGLSVQKSIKKETILPSIGGSASTHNSIDTAKSIKTSTIKTNMLKSGVSVSLESLTRTKQSKDLLKKILLKNGVNEESVAKTMISLSKNKDYRAKTAYIDRAVKYLGYDYESPDKPTMSQSNIVIMPNSIVDKYQKSTNVDSEDLKIAEIE